MAAHRLTQTEALDLLLLAKRLFHTDCRRAAGRRMARDLVTLVEAQHANPSDRDSLWLAIWSDASELAVATVA